MILLSPDAVEDVERLRTFLDQTNPGAARRLRAFRGLPQSIEDRQQIDVGEGELVADEKSLLVPP